MAWEGGENKGNWIEISRATVEEKGWSAATADTGWNEWMKGW